MEDNSTETPSNKEEEEEGSDNRFVRICVAKSERNLQSGTNNHIQPVRS